MRHLLLVLGLIVATAALAGPAPPVISHNVHVIPNSSVSQCEAYNGGRVGPEENVTTDSRFGDASGEANAGVRSCSSCRLDGKSGDCVCDTCYDYFN